MPNNPTYFELLKACTQPGCPVCRLEQEAVERYLDHLFYESVNDPGVRAHLRNSLGFCQEHTRLILNARLGGALGMSIIYHDVLGTVLKRLLGTKALSDESTIFSRLLGRIPADLETIRKRIRQAISPHEPCLGCRQRDSTAYMVLSVLMEKIQDQEMLAAFANSDGLCLPHLRLGCKLAQDEVALAELLKVELEKLEKLHTELAEFVRKNDYRYIKDGFGPEGNAWRRAAQLAAGGQVNKQDHA